MRIPILPLLLLVSIMPKSCFAQHVFEEKPSIVNIPSQALKNCNNEKKICYTLNMTRRDADEIMLLQLPQDLIDTNACLYREADYYKYENNPTFLDYKVKRHDDRKPEHSQPITLNMRWLETGDYLLVFEGKNRQGIIKIALSTGPTTVKELPPIVVSIDTHLIYQNDTCSNFSVRRHKKQPIFITAPLGGTNSYVGLYTPDWFLRKHHKISEEALRYDGKAILEGQRPTIELTTLKDGHYVLLYQSCAFYAKMELELTTQ